MPTHLLLGSDAPHPSQLKTGDLLFPRRVPELSRCYDLHPAPIRSAEHEYGAGEGRADNSSLHGMMAKLKELVTPSTDPVNFSSPEYYQLMRIFKTEFHDLIPNWFKMNADDFFEYPLTPPFAKLLLEGLQGQRGQGFFIGHSAMVIRNNEGGADEDVYVIEANITDYAHYGVAIHPYYCSDDADVEDSPSTSSHPSKKLFGWVNRRRAMGERVWHKRHSYFQAGNQQEHTALRIELARQAKKHLGTSYGIMDSLTYDDTGRLYCFEFMDVIYKEAAKNLGIPAAAIELDENRNWPWLIGALKDPFQKDLTSAMNTTFAANGQTIGSILLANTTPPMPCPLLTSHMLFRSTKLTATPFNGPQKNDGVTLEDDFVQ